ncbi:MAG: ATP-dependent DNA helicase UvrD2 [Acidimicrobiales bacterium]
MEPDELLAGLNRAQAEAVRTTARPLCILAGAGSGKTRVLTRRIAWRVAHEDADSSHVLALTFTRKAAGEMRGRLAALGVRPQVVAGTFHSVAYAQLRRYWADRGDAEPALLDRKVRVLAGLVPNRGDRTQTAPVLADIAAEIEWAKARMIAPESYPDAAARADRKAPLAPSDMARVYQRYEEDKRRRGLVDFDDLLSRCALALEEDPTFAASQRWRFRHVFVDEFQDVNPVQFRLLRAWLSNNTDLCVVGDPNQAIYSWNGADPELLNQFGSHFPGAEVIHLQRNYRSSPQILALANAVLSEGPQGHAGGTGTPVAGAPGPSFMEPDRPDGPLPSITAFDSDTSEARGIAMRLRQAHRPGLAWSHMAVLARTNAQLVLVAEALSQAEIPYRLGSGTSFKALPEIKMALANLTGERPDGSFAVMIKDLETMAAQARGGASDSGGAEERRGNLEALVRLAREYASMDDAASPKAFVSWLDTAIRGSADDRSSDVVELATFHRAKGLEWPIVMIAGLEKGFVPIGQASGPAALAEERRLLYVAMTRAETELHCSWAARRTFGSRRVRREPSPHLDIIAMARSALAAGQEPGSVAAWLLESRRRLTQGGTGSNGVGPNRIPGDRRTGGRRQGAASRGPTPGYQGDSIDQEVLEALRSWRAITARASGVPAYVIFHDTTLAALASAKPTTADGLLGTPGLGPVKAARYGDKLLELIAGGSR